jgi:xanthine dehydrogenase accessory factor
VRAQALTLLDSAESLLLRISPVEETAQPGKLTVVNPCLSGGTLEIFLQPVVPAPLVALHGDAPIAMALRTIGAALGYHVADFWEAALDQAAAVVVASHGRDEEPVLAAALRIGVPYIGLVASRKRGEAVVAALDHPEANRVHTPAGLDLGARTPEEVALSILAEIVSLRPRPSGRPLGEGDRSHDGHTHQAMTASAAEAAGSSASPGSAAATARDPVCGMSVATVDASLHLDHGGRRWWFCGSGCLRAFAADPGAYALT